jgi:hypothetical protein
MQLFGVGAGAGSSRRRYSTIIVLDEIDMLMTKDQAVSNSQQHAAVLAIAFSLTWPYRQFALVLLWPWCASAQ